MPVRLWSIGTPDLCNGATDVRDAHIGWTREMGVSVMSARDAVDEQPLGDLAVRDEGCHQAASAQCPDRVHPLRLGRERNHMVGSSELGFGDGNEPFLEAIGDDRSVGVEEQAAAFGYGAASRERVGFGFGEVVVDGR